MKVCAVICELNPFHNGHEYLFKEIRNITGADFIIAIMSGDFVQRGVPAICDKYARCEMALMGGADLVLELPVMYSTASADYFAQGAVSCAVNCGIVDMLCFGSESGDMNMLRSCAGLFEESDPGLHILSQGADSEKSKSFRISRLLKEGSSYAKAYAEVTGNEFAANDMLAVRYIKSLSILGSDIKPVCIKRTGGSYNDASASSFSALSVRKRIMLHEDYAHLVPKYVYRKLESLSGKQFPVVLNDLSVQLHTILTKIISEEERYDADLTSYMDVSENIAGRIRSNLIKYRNYDDFVSIVHSKEYTKSRVLRALMHILLDVKKEDYAADIADIDVPYIRILGFRRSSTPLLSALKEACVVPVISKAADAGSLLDDEAYAVFEKDIAAANLYDMVCTFKYKNVHAHDCSREVVVI